MSKNNGITWFKVIQVHYFWYQSKARMRRSVSEYNNLHPISHGLHNITEYWFSTGVSHFNALDRG